MEMPGYNQLWRAIIRPPRAEYETTDLGPDKFLIDGADGKKHKIQRTDFTLQNNRGSDIICSHFEPYEETREWQDLPCVIYMHGNSSCRMESLETVHYLLPQNITMFCFDFAGCGISGGDFISLGWWERDDVAMIVDHLRASRRVSTIALWGRSMGAVTALLHADRDPSIAGLVLDSPFSNLSKLVNELSYNYTKLPSFLVSPVLKLISSTIKSKADFDIYQLSPIDHVKNSFIPALFATATEDDFIKPHHCKELHEAYQGDKNIVTFDGDHNSQRPQFFFDSASIFLYTTLQCDQILTPEKKFTRVEMELRKKEIREQKRLKAEQERREAEENKDSPVKEESEYCNCGQEHEHQHNHHPQVRRGEDELDVDDESIQVPQYQNGAQLLGAGFGEDDDEQMLAAAIAASMEQMKLDEANRNKGESDETNQEQQYLIDCMKNEEEKKEPASDNKKEEDLIQL